MISIEGNQNLYLHIFILLAWKMEYIFVDFVHCVNTTDGIE